MRVFLVFEHNWEGLAFQAAYEHLEPAVEHARTLHHTAEVHETYLHEEFIPTTTKDIKSHLVWSSLDQ